METLLWIAALWALMACAVHGRERASAARRVGVILHAESAPVFVIVLYVSLGILALMLVLRSALAIPSCALIVLSSAAVVLARYQRAEACGTGGVQKGCSAYAFVELEEWRLTGDHLRFRVDEVWRAVSLPPQLHAEVRELLEQHARGRESRFSK